MPTLSGSPSSSHNSVEQILPVRRSLSAGKVITLELIIARLLIWTTQRIFRIAPPEWLWVVYLGYWEPNYRSAVPIHSCFYSLGAVSQRIAEMVGHTLPSIPTQNKNLIWAWLKYYVEGEFQRLVPFQLNFVWYVCSSLQFTSIAAMLLWLQQNSDVVV